MLPQRPKLLNDNEAPIWMTSRTDIEEPKLARPNIEKADPTRPIDLRDREEPS
jgi:hypothetical protein